MPVEKKAATVHERMIAIVDALPAIGKSQYNQQQKFHFRGHDDVLNALTPLLAEHGVVIVPRVLERVTAQRTTAKGSIMYEVNLHIEYTFYGAAGDSITGSAWGEGTDMGDKATMKAGTMAFKAMLNQAFAINTAEGAAHDTDKGAVEETVRQPSGGNGASGPPVEGEVRVPVTPGEAVVHFGKNSGKRLGELTEFQVKWYAEDWEPTFSDPRDQILKDAAVKVWEESQVPF